MKFPIFLINLILQSSSKINEADMMPNIKPVILSSLCYLRYFDILRYLQKNRVIILMYHRFSDLPEPFKIQQKVFENQIKFLKKRYTFISLNHYAKILTKQRENCPLNAIILTIDDGYRDNYLFAYPILKKYSIPATIFLTTDFITHKSWLWANKLEYILKNAKLSKFTFPLGDKKSMKFQVDNFSNWHQTQLTIFNYCRTIAEYKKNELLNELASHLKVNVPEQTIDNFKPLTWNQIKEMHRDKINFGSHTCSHPILTKISLNELEHEVVDSKRVIENQLETEVMSFCYPNGEFNHEVIKMIQNTGYSCSVNTEKGANGPKNIHKFLLKRISISTDSKRYLSRETTSFIFY